MRYKIDFSPQAFEDVSKSDRPIAERVLKKIDWLAENCGVIYKVDSIHKSIVVHFVGHRREIYKT